MVPIQPGSENFETVFMAAKYIAQLNGEDEISKESLFDALNNFEIENDWFLAAMKEFGYRQNEPKIIVDRACLEVARKAKKISFIPEIMDFLDKDNCMAIEVEPLFQGTSLVTIDESGKVIDKDDFGLSSNKDFYYSPITLETPVGELKVNQKTIAVKIEELKASLASRIYSQEEMINAVTNSLIGIGSSDESPVKAIFLFLGPPAVGKTETAKALKEYFPDYSFKEFNMGHYRNGRDSTMALLGSTQTYNNSAPGELTGYVKDNPKSILVFDEVEKSAVEVQDLFLDILSNGYTKDIYFDYNVSFRECIFIFTSNSGSELYNNDSFMRSLAANPEDAQEILLEQLYREKKTSDLGQTQNTFKPEFLSRLAQGEIILFNKLNFNAYTKIAAKVLDKKISNFEKLYTKIEFDEINKDQLIKILIFDLMPRFDVRALKKKFASKLFKKLQEYLVNKNKNNLTIKCVKITLDENAKRNLDKILSGKNEDILIKECFRKNESLDSETKLNLESDILVARISIGSEPKKLPKSQDFDGEMGSIIIDLPNIEFDQIAGHEEVKDKLREISKLLLNKKELDKFNVSAPRGMLLYGPPGTGKTMLAKAFANEAKLPFIETTGTEMLNISTMIKIFKRAREYAPAIIFIDEIEVFGDRAKNSAFDYQINQFLTELNGFSDAAGIFVIAATNYPERLDAAITRSGRLDLAVEVGMLDPQARGYFIDKILKLPLQKGINKAKLREKLIKFSSLMSGADIEKVKREAIYETIKKGLDGISEEILLEQINTIKYGKKILNKNMEFELESTAYHEAGHAVISHILCPQVKIEQITVMPRGRTMGFVSYNNDEIRSNDSFEDIKNQTVISFAGRVAEIKFCGSKGVNSGASNDLKQASDRLFWAITNLGMGELGYVNIAGCCGADYINELAQKEVLKILGEQKNRCESLVDKHWNSIEKIAKILIEKEMIDEAEFLSVIKGDKVD